MLSALDYHVIRKVQHIIRNPGHQSYLSLKQAFLKLYKISDNDLFDQLLYRTNLNDREPYELLFELRTLLGTSRSDNVDLNKLLSKLLLDNLRAQERTHPSPPLKSFYRWFLAANAFVNTMHFTNNKNS